MKNTLIIGLVMMALMLVAMPFVLAENETDAGAEPMLISANPDNSSNADSLELESDLNESVSGLKIGWQKFGLWFTFNQEKKAEKELKIAHLELNRARMAAKNNDTEGFDNAMAAHDRILERAKERLGKIDTKETPKGLESFAAMQKAILVHEARIAKLNNLLLSENLTDEQIANIEAKIAKAENVTSKLQDVQDNKREKLQTKLMAKGNLTQEQVDEQLSSIEDAQNLSELREALKEMKQERKNQADSCDKQGRGSGNSGSCPLEQD